MEFMNTLNLAELLADINLTSVVQFFYFNAILITITLNVFPPFARKLYTYGKNASDTKPTKAATKDVDKKPRTTTEPKSPLDVLLDLVGKLQVPHSWFMHFYAFSFAVQLFWLLQVIFHGRILQLVLDNLPGNQPPKDAVVEPQIVPGPDGSQSLETILLCIICMTMQSARRLWESIYIQKSGNSKMGILIYIAGITHYTMMGFATWCEGIETLRLNTNIPISHPSDLLKPPRINTLLAIPFFFLGSGLQHDAHVHLASLVKYSLPIHPLFSYTLSPHYLLECVIYGSFVVIGAPKGQWLNKSLLYVWIFVCINLGFGANITRKWYEGKFGRKSVEDKWRLVPYIKVQNVVGEGFISNVGGTEPSMSSHPHLRTASS
ncbi:hypothetical protein TWF970_007678 [Orbilia oligospora]|uniref:Polyprenal reductase n=1 Tax=Orbilia oligospora TaxID=2813651 RepID=A0A7C8VDF5_ORBOL|nr:hypothetical protein TWF970_007678 [Orbilia oligospora]